MKCTHFILKYKVYCASNVCISQCNAKSIAPELHAFDIEIQSVLGLQGAFQIEMCARKTLIRDCNSLVNPFITINAKGKPGVRQAHTCKCKNA